MWARFPSPWKLLLFSQETGEEEHCSVWDGGPSCLQTHPELHQLILQAHNCSFTGHTWALGLQFLQLTEEEKGGANVRHLCPGTEQPMQAGLLSLAPWEAGGLVDIHSQYRSWLWHENQANSHKDQKEGKGLDSISMFQNLCLLRKPN